MAADRAAAAALPLDVAARLVFDHLPIPICVLDGDCRLVAMNPAAEHFWGADLADVAGSVAADVLGVRPAQDAAGQCDPLQQALEGALDRVPCRITGRDGITHMASLVGARLRDTDHSAISVVAEQSPPAWALIDPVTGIPNRLAWETDRERWHDVAGAVVVFDLDDLKEINDLYGHRSGDQALAAVGQTLRTLAPPGASVFRWGGDEFLLLVAVSGLNEAERLAAAVREQVGDLGQTTLPLRPILSFGAATFGPGEVDAALRQADDALYEAKGVLLRAGSGARLVLTREGQRLMLSLDDGPGPSPTDYASRFTSSFDAYFRAVLQRAVVQAERFVAFSEPPIGGAVVELGAGSGRITLDGGLAQRVGPRGHLLVTDPSAAQLRLLRERLSALDLPWVRLLRSPAETLPVAAGCVDMVIGSTFLHFTDAYRVMREVARVLRPGGRFALAAPLPFPWPAFWEDVLAPVFVAGGRLGLGVRHWAVPEDEIVAAVQAAGLQVDRCQQEADYAGFPTPDVTQSGLRQLQLIALMLPGAPADRLAAVEEEVLRRIAERWDAYTEADRGGSFVNLHLVARKP